MMSVVIKTKRGTRILCANIKTEIQMSLQAFYSSRSAEIIKFPKPRHYTAYILVSHYLSSSTKHIANRESSLLLVSINKMSSQGQASESSPLSISADQSEPECVSRDAEPNVIPTSEEDANYDIYNPAVLFDTIVWIHVGPPATKKVFGMHKGLLCHHSSYFKAALIGPFSQQPGALKRVIVLEDENIQTFERFNSWIYSDLLSTHWTMRQLIDLYIFAEKRLIRRFQNSLMDMMTTMVEWDRQSISTRLANHAWKSSMKIRTFLVDTFVEQGNPSGAHGLEREFLAAVVRRYKELYNHAHFDRPGRMPYEDDAHVMRVVLPFEFICERYHAHERGEPSCGDGM